MEDRREYLKVRLPAPAVELIVLIVSVLSSITALSRCLPTEHLLYTHGELPAQESVVI